MQICDLNRNVRGTGFLIGSKPWRVITCEHVADNAGVPRTADAEERLLVCFPEADVEPPDDVRPARVVGRLDPEFEDDVVILELDSPEPPVLPEDVLTLAPADDPDEHRFKSYGFRALGAYGGGIASGNIEGAVPPPEGTYLCERLQLTSPHIDHGMSGAPVFDVAMGQVIGMICETFVPEAGAHADQDTAWAVDGRILASFAEWMRPSSPILPPITGPVIGSALAPTGAVSGRSLEGAPALIHKFVGREDEIAWLTDRWRDPGCPIAYIVAPAGQGKTALVRQWLETLELHDTPEVTFWWGFGAAPGIDEFFTTSLDFFSGGEVPASLRVESSRGFTLAAYLAGGRKLLVLDDIGALGSSESKAGGEIAQMLASLADDRETTYMCIVTVRTPPPGIDVPVLDLPPLDEYSVVDILDERGVPPIDARGIAISVGVPLAAELIGKHRSSATEIAVRDHHEQPDQLIRQLSLIARDHLTPGAANLLRVVCLLRRPVPLSWAPELASVARIGLGVPVPSPDSAVQELLSVALLQEVDDESRTAISMHRAIRSVFAEELGEERSAVHSALSDMWWERRPLNEHTGEVEWRPAQSLSELRPAIEAVHHLCAAGRPDDAFDRLVAGVYRGRSFALVNQLGEWAIDQELVREFFPNGDLHMRPTVEDPTKASILLNEAALDLRMLGRPDESLTVFERAAEVGAGEAEHLAVAALARQSETLVELGQLARAEEVAKRGLVRAEYAGDQQSTWYSHGTLAWPVALRGRFGEALAHYRRAVEIRGGLAAGLIAVRQTLTLWWAGNTDDAHRVLAEASELADWENDLTTIAELTRVAGEIDADDGEDPEYVIQVLRVAVKRASALAAPQPRIQALTALGAAVTAYAGEVGHDMDEAAPLLMEALRLTDSSGMRLFEPAVRIGMAHFAFLKEQHAEAEAHLSRAEALAAEFGNTWDLERLRRLRREGSRLRIYSLAPPWVVPVDPDLL